MFRVQYADIQIQGRFWFLSVECCDVSLRSISHCMLEKHLTAKSYGTTQNSSRLPKSSEEFCSHWVNEKNILENHEFSSCSNCFCHHYIYSINSEQTKMDAFWLFQWSACLHLFLWVFLLHKGQQSLQLEHLTVPLPSCIFLSVSVEFLLWPLHNNSHKGRASASSFHIQDKHLCSSKMTVENMKLCNLKSSKKRNRDLLQIKMLN